jgi:hypothetical protein
MSERSIKNHAAFIWPVADLLRWDYKESEYNKVVMDHYAARVYSTVRDREEV